MKYAKFKSLGSFIAFAAILAACNSNSSSDKIADTASTPAYTSPDVSGTEVTTAPDTSMAMMDTATTASKPKAAITTKKRKIVVEAEPENKTKKIEADKSGIYTYADVAPVYPGGQSAIEDFINNHIQYPQIALDNNVEGRTGVSFVVDEKGKVKDVHLAGKKLGSGLDEEAERVVASMPDWKPGIVKGKPVQTRMTLPIVFQIEE